MITEVPQGIKCIPDPAFSNIIKNLVVFRPEFRVCHDNLMFVEIVQFKMYAKSTFSQCGGNHRGVNIGVQMIMKRIKYTKDSIKINCIFNDIKKFPYSHQICIFSLLITLTNSTI